jgi:Na+-driven multidrug efflux pump
MTEILSRSEEKEKEGDFKFSHELWLVAKASIPVIVAEFCRLFMNVIDTAFIVRSQTQSICIQSKAKLLFDILTKAYGII